MSTPTSPSKLDEVGSVNNSPRTPSRQALSADVSVKENTGTGVLDITEWPVVGCEDNGKLVAAADVSNDIRARIRSSPIPPDGVGSRNSSQNSSNKSLPVNGTSKAGVAAVVGGSGEAAEDNDARKVKLITAYEAKKSGYKKRHRSTDHDLAGGNSQRIGQAVPSSTVPENAAPEMIHNIAAVSEGVPSAAANAQKLRQQEALVRLDEQVVSELSLSYPAPHPSNAGGDVNNCTIS